MFLFFRSSGSASRDTAGSSLGSLRCPPTPRSSILCGTLPDRWSTQDLGRRERRGSRCDHVGGGGPPSACVYPTLRQTWPRAIPEAAMCVRKISAQCVLQFTPSLAAGCVLHRPVSRVIHCSELCFFFSTELGDISLRPLRSRIVQRSDLSPGGGEAFEAVSFGFAPAALSRTADASRIGARPRES